jgi:tetratricopeptide (TPR) repeat protein
MRLLALLSLVALAMAQGDPTGQGLEREQMWPAPTAEDWKKPVRLTFQRTWKDAVEVSKKTNRPILVCINMDGEIASEHYAGIRYRSREIAKLYEPYICVIASVYRHNPRDFDDQGKRILCPRFGSVTCGEHIWIEPVIYKKFCDGVRVAPRHIAVDLDGKESYDVYYRNDTASVFADIRDKVPTKEGREPIVIRGDRPLLERVASRDVRDRSAIEDAYEKGDPELRKSLLDSALKNKNAEQLGLLRLAIFGLDVDLAKQGRTALAGVQTSDAADLIAEAMQIPMEDAEREALIAALQKMGDKSARARWLASIHNGLSKTSGTVVLKGWSKERAGASYPAPKLAFGGYGRVSHVEDKARDADARPDDPSTRIELAEASLALAMKADASRTLNPRLARQAKAQLFEDAHRYANEAEAIGAKPWRVSMVRALALYYNGQVSESFPHAEKAVKELPPGDPSWSSMAVVTIFAEARWKAIKAAVNKNERWPPEWLSDLDSAYALLLRHPLGTDRQVAWHYDLLDWLSARRRAMRVLEDGIERFPKSLLLHNKLRTRTLRFRGPGALEKTYARMVKKSKKPTHIAYFAGVASTAAANAYRRMQRHELAMSAYDRALAFYRGMDPQRKRGSLRAIAMTYAGVARVHYQLKNDDAALKAILASFLADRTAAGTRDGLGITPGETGQMLGARLRENKNEAAAKKLEEAMTALDPDLLRSDIGFPQER